jgi:hypothetical protein
VGIDGEPRAPADRNQHTILARRVTHSASRPSILDLITEREAVAGAAADRLREQIATLTDQLTAAETELAELAITRTTLTRLTGDATATTPADTTVASPAYQQILALFATATGGMRAKDICHALGTSVTAKDTEGMRAKLKRLVNRQILAETEPGLFTLAPAATSE